MVDFRDRDTRRRQPQLRTLQQTQEEIYRQLQLLIPDEAAQDDRFCSRVDGSPVLRLEILERHPFTHFIRLTYDFEGRVERRLAPDAHIRLYQDAKIAEVTAFDGEQAFKRAAHPWYPSGPLLERTWRENLALDKWLGYLLQQGHSFETMRVAARGIPEETPAEAPVELV
jgi:YD repeat-containing protein